MNKLEIWREEYQGEDGIYFRLHYKEDFFDGEYLPVSGEAFIFPAFYNNLSSEQINSLEEEIGREIKKILPDIPWGEEIVIFLP
jgi:hypothetical protein